MRPITAYRRINKLLWLNRLPKATFMFTDNTTMPNALGVTLDNDGVFEKPVIVLNVRYRRWGKTLVHEMIHIAEPTLRHGRTFEALVNLYWKIVKTEVKGFNTK